MPKILTPRLQYDSTAARPRWSQLPQHVRDLIERHLGGAVHAEESAGGGFTSGYAAVVEGTHGSQFVKAVDARTNPVVAECYRREALINEALPSAVPAPRIRWLDEQEGWLVIAFDAVEGGRMPAAPWTTDDLNLTLATYAVTAEALAEPSEQLQQVGLKPVGDGGDFDDWRTVTSGAPSAKVSLPDWVNRPGFGRDLRLWL